MRRKKKKKILKLLWNLLYEKWKTIASVVRKILQMKALEKLKID